MSTMQETCAEEQAEPRPPLLAKGRPVKLPGRGTLFVREVEGPAGAPTLLLLHGWMASAGLNWHHAFRALGEHFRVIAPDQRGHARGIRSWRRFRLDDCADDAAALLDVLGIESAIAVGYSMGGPVAKLLWRRHPARVSGLVLCATSPRPVRTSNAGAAAFRSAMIVAAGVGRISQLAIGVPTALRRRFVERVTRDPDSIRPSWAAAEFSRHDFRMMLEAGAELGRFDSQDWFRTIDVPTAVVVTTEDRAIPPEHQMLLARHIPDARVFCLDLGHDACRKPDFAGGLLAACHNVVQRAAMAQPPARRARARAGLEIRIVALLA